MQFISLFKIGATTNVRKLESQADDTLELPGNIKALRIEDEVVIVDTKKNKVVKKLKDTFPSNPARATLGIMKKLKLASNYENYKDSIDKSTINKQTSELWTCGFRPDEERWVWYKNSEPKITVAFNETNYNHKNIEDKLYFHSAKFGTKIIEEIKKNGLKDVAKNINALILDNSYAKLKCPNCKVNDNYTIDDLVDEKKKAKYDSNFIVCSSCDKLIRLA